MRAKIYLKILRIGAIASLAIIFFISTNLLFPYITSKQIPFNILMEVLLVFWLVFIWRFPQYRPKKNYISLGLVAYFLAILASCAVSVDFNLSFWGDAERMLGFFHLLHFLILYYIIITAFRSWSDWKLFLITSVMVATAVSVIGLVGANVYSVIGNTAYVSGYLIFNLYFCVLLFFREKSRGWRYLYLLPLIVMLLEFWAADTSGAIIGLSFSILAFFFLLGLFHRRKIFRRISLITFIIAVLVIIGIFSQRNSQWFQEKDFLRGLTFQKATFQTRLISWQSAAKDFKYHPIFGTGFGNYAIIFDKHFDSKFFDHARTETYFDRAHNNLIDITSTTGLVGLITYLSIFVAVIYYLRKQFRDNGGIIGLEGKSLQNLEITLIASLLIAYFVQNLAVFDSFSTYIGLMMLLAFISWLIQGESLKLNESDAGKKGIKELYIFILILAIVFFGAMRVNIKSWRMFAGAIASYNQIMQGNLWTGINLAHRALDSNDPLSRDGRAMLVNISTANPKAFLTLNESQSQEALDYIVSLAQKNVKYNPRDTLMQLQLAQISDTVARSNYNDLDRFNYYSSQAVQAIDNAIDSSPKRLPLYLTKGQILLARGEKEKAIETMEYAISLNPRFPDGHCRLAQVYLLLGYTDKVEEPMNACMDTGGTQELKSAQLLMSAIAYYANKGEFGRALPLTERLSVIDPKNPEVWFNLARLYLKVGDRDKALLAGDNVITLDGRLKESVDALFKEE